METAVEEDNYERGGDLRLHRSSTLYSTLIFTCVKRQSMDYLVLLLISFVKSRQVEARKTWQHMSSRSLISNMS